MPLLRGRTLPEKQRKKSFFSRFRKQNKTPNVGVGNNWSDQVEVKTIQVLFRSINDSWHQHQGLGNDGYQHQSSTSAHILLLKLTNILGAVYMMGVDLYTLTFHWEVFYAGTGGKQTYFTPAPWSFLMWSVIHVLILGGCIHQFFHPGSSVLIDQMGWKLPLLHILNAMYIRCRSNQRYKYAFVLIVVTYMVVNNIYRKISRISSRDIRDQLFYHLSFSLYHGWVLGLVFLAGFEAFGVDALTTPARSGTKMFVLFSFMIIQAFEWAYASPATEGDVIACLAVSWFLFAIMVEQSPVRSAFAHWSAHGFTTFSLCWITQCMVGMELKRL